MNLKIENKDTYTATEQGRLCLLNFLLFLPSLPPYLPLFFLLVSDLFLFFLSFLFFPLSFLSSFPFFLLSHPQLRTIKYI